MRRAATFYQLKKMQEIEELISAGQMKKAYSLLALEFGNTDNITDRGLLTNIARLKATMKRIEALRKEALFYAASANLRINKDYSE